MDYGQTITLAYWGGQRPPSERGPHKHVKHVSVKPTVDGRYHRRGMEDENVQKVIKRGDRKTTQLRPDFQMTNHEEGNGGRRWTSGDSRELGPSIATEPWRRRGGANIAGEGGGV